MAIKSRKERQGLGQGPEGRRSGGIVPSGRSMRDAADLEGVSIHWVGDVPKLLEPVQLESSGQSEQCVPED